MKLYFTINALSHCDWKDCTAQLVEEVQDKHVLLVAEENNVDCNAVRVHFAGKTGISFYKINLKALDAAYSIAFPKSTPLNVNKKKKSASKQEKSEHKHE